MADINKLVNANVYLDDGSLLGKVKEIELPTLTQKMASHEALGMIGEIELPSGFEKLEGKIMWNSLYADTAKKIADPTKAYRLQVRGNLESHNAGGLEGQVPAVALLTVRFTESPMGNFKQHENAEYESSYAAYYAKMEVDGDAVFEFDPISNIFVVDGVDKLADYRNNLGI